MALAETAQLVVDLRLNDQLSGGIHRAEGEIAGLNRTAGGSGTAVGGLSRAMGGLSTVAAGVGGAMSHAGGQIKNLVTGPAGILAMTGGTLALGAALKDTVSSATDFQSSMELIATQAGGTQAEVDAMTKGILAMATSVGTAPDVLAAGLYHIESAGLRGAQALDILKIAAEGAKVGNADLESVTNALVAAVNSGIAGAGDMTTAMGTLNAVVGAGNMRMQDLTDAFSTGILATAKTFGISIQSVGAAIADMTNQGVPAIDAATRLRMSLSLLAAPTESAAKQFEKIGLGQLDLANTMRGPGGIMAAVQQLADHMRKAGLIDANGQPTSAGADLLSKAFGGGRSSSAIMTLIGSLGKLNDIQDQINKGAGNFGDAWTKTTQEAEFSFAKFQSAVGVLAIRLGNALLPPLSEAASMAADWLGDPNNQQSLVGGLNAAIDAAKTLGQGIKDFVLPPLKILGDIIGAIPGPIKELAAAGFLFNKSFGWLFGTSPLQIGKSLLGGLLGKVPVVGGALGAIAGVPHVWVDNMPMGGIGGGGVGPAAAVGGGALATALGVGLAAAAGLAIASWVKSGGLNDILKNTPVGTGWTDPELTRQSQGIVGQVQKQISGGASLADLEKSLAAVKTGLRDLYGSDNPNALQSGITDALYGQQANDLKEARKALEAAIMAATGSVTPSTPPRPGGAANPLNRDMDKTLGPAADALAIAAKAMGKGTTVTATLSKNDLQTINHYANAGRDTLVAMAKGLEKLDPGKALKAAADLVTMYTSGTAAAMRGQKGALDWIAANEAKVAAAAAKFDAQGDHVTAAKLRAKLDELKAVEAQVRQQQTNTVVATQQAAKRTQDVHDRLVRLNADENANASRTRAQLANQKPPVVNTHVSVPVSVSVVDIFNGTTVGRFSGGAVVWAGNRNSGVGRA